MKTLHLILVMLFAPILVFGQADAPAHTYEMGGKIDFMRLTESGILIVGGGGGIAGINPDGDKPHFIFNDYGKVKEENVEFVPMTPYIIVTKDGGIGAVFGKSERSVFDIVSGKKIFETNANGWKAVTALRLFIPMKKLVVVGVRKGFGETDLNAGIYNLETGAEEGLLKLGAAGANPESGTPSMVGSRLIVPSPKQVACVDITTGQELWSLPIKKLTSVEADESGSEIYGFEEANNQTRIYKFSIDGKQLWNKEYKIKGIINRFEILPQGIAVVSDAEGGSMGGLIGKAISSKGESKIAFIDAKTGQDLWEKAPKTKGYVQHFYIQDDGILFGMGNGGINKISFNGQQLFKKPLKTGPNIHTLAQTEQGIIYITEEDADIINPKTGESVWGKPIKYKKASSVASAYDKDRNRYLLSTGNELLAINAQNGEVGTLSKISFEGKEQPDNIEVRDQGILLTSDQNMLFLDFDGNEVWKTYHRSPGKSAVGGILAGVSGAASMLMTTSLAMGAAGYKHVHQYNKADIYMDSAGNFEKLAMQSFSEMAKRFKATSASQNAQFILTKLDNGAGLVKVNKDTGEVEKEIGLNDKKPEYVIDEWGGVLYYQSGRSTLQAFDLK